MGIFKKIFPVLIILFLASCTDPGERKHYVIPVEYQGKKYTVYGDDHFPLSWGNEYFFTFGPVADTIPGNSDEVVDAREKLMKIILKKGIEDVCKPLKPEYSGSERVYMTYPKGDFFPDDNVKPVFVARHFYCK